MVLVDGSWSKIFRLRDPGWFLIRTLISYELVSVFVLVVFCMNAFVLSDFEACFALMMGCYCCALCEGQSRCILRASGCMGKYYSPQATTLWNGCVLSSTLLDGTRSTAAVQVMFLNDNESCITVLNNVNFNLCSFSSWYKPFEGNGWKRGYCLDHLKES